jgi:hypothetical protein
MVRNVKYLSTGLLVFQAFLILLGLLISLLGNEFLSSRVFFIASVCFPFTLASKGMEYIISNQLFKALLSIILLSLVCVLSIIFVFV